MNVYISGTAMVSGLGSRVDDHVAAVARRDSSITRDRHFGADYPLGWLSRADEFEGEDRLFDISRRAVHDCIASAALSDDELRSTGLIFAQSTPDSGRLNRETERFHSRGRCRPDALLKIMNSYTPSALAKELAIEAPVLPVSAACCGSGLALHIGLMMIRNGTLERCLCGGGEIVDVFTRMGFESMKLALASGELEKNPVKPFGADRSGLVLGEGSAFVLLESEKSVASRADRAEPYCRVENSLYGNVPQAQYGDLPDESRWIDLIGSMLAEGAPDIIISHGTSTVRGDLVEGKALQHCLPDVPVLQYKRAYGHCLSASTLLDLALGAQALKGGQCCGADVDYELQPELSGVPLRQKVRGTIQRVLKISAGFGGGISAISIASA